MSGWSMPFPQWEATLDVPIGTGATGVSKKTLRLWLSRKSLGDCIGGHGEEVLLLRKVQAFAAEFPAASFQQWFEFLKPERAIAAAQVLLDGEDGVRWGIVVYNEGF